MKFNCLLFALFFLQYTHQGISQSIELPTISSQYLTQGNDYGAALIRIHYQSGSPEMQLGKERQALNQKNLYTYLDMRYTKLDKTQIGQENVKVEAPEHLPVHFLQDIYAWIQIYGCKSIHLALYESMDPSKVRYLPLDVLAFPPLEAACTYHAQQSKVSSTAIATLNKIHPNTTQISTERSEKWSVEARDIRPIHYIPQQIIDIKIDNNDVVVYEGQTINTMVLGSMIQNKLMEHYKSSHQKASPDQYLWLNLDLQSKVSYQQYAEVLLALQEAFHLYWEELAYNKYQNAYMELDVQQQWNIRQAAPKLIAQFSKVQRLYLNDKLSKGNPRIWSDL